jgi:hypothetical protein
MPLDQLDQSGPTCQILAGLVGPDNNMYYLIAGGQ